MNIISKYPDEDKTLKRGWKYYVPLSVIMTLLFICMLALAFVICQLPDIFAEETEVKGEPIQHIQEFIVPQADVEEEKPEPVVHLTDDDMIAMVVMREAGNQEMIGKVAVVMTILNRCDYYDATVEQIITAPNQYAYPCTGEISPDCYRAIKIARKNRDLFPSTMMWFLPSGYPQYGEPYMKIQDHYFSYIPETEEN